ncbi:MAG: lipocalin family protein [Saprospiraceae bacterium]
MKQIKILSLLAIIALFISCNKDSNSEASLVGTWLPVSSTSENCSDSTDDQDITYTDGCYSEPILGFSICESITFNSDNTYESTSTISFLGQQSSETENGTYTVSDGTLTICDENGDCSSGDFTISGSTLTFYYVDSDTGCENTTVFKK